VVDDPLILARREAEQERAQSEIIRAQDADKEKARKAMIMADNDQDAATYAYGNYDVAYKAYKGKLTTHIVDNDPMLQTYFNTNPMAPLISKDDVVNLSDYNKSMKPLTNMFRQPEVEAAGSILDIFDENTLGAAQVGLGEIIHGIIPTFAGAYGMGAGASVGAGIGTAAGVLFPPAAPITIPVGGFIGALGGALVAAFAASTIQEEAIEKLWPEEAARKKKGEEEHPYAAIAGQVLSAAPAFGLGGLTRQALLASIPARAGGGAVMAGIEAAQEMVNKGELDPAALSAWFVGGAIFAGNPHWFGLTSVKAGETLAGRVFGTGRFITDHIRQGELPPKGVNPIWDYLLAEDAKEGMKLHDDAQKAAKSAETLTSSPELMGKLSDQHTKGEIGLKWDGVKKLYGEDMPEPGDGKLGDIPGIIEQFKGSLKSGEDISVPWRHWANTDAEVVKFLHDDVRLPDKYTINEANKVPDPSTLPIEDWSPVFESKAEQAIHDARKATGLGEPLLLPTEIEKDILRDAGYTESEIRRIRPDQLAKAREGYAYMGGELRKVEPEHVAQAQAERTKAREAKAKDQEKFNAAVEAVKDQPNKYPNFGNLLGSDWQVNLRGMPQTKEGFIQGAQQALEQKYGYMERNAARLERIAERMKPPPEPPEPGLEDTVLFEPGVILPKRQYERMVRDIAEVLKADEAKKLAVEERKAARKRTPAWNKEAAKMHEEVSKEIDQKPEWMAWKFLTTGEIRGQKLKPARISRESITPEQAKDLPDGWLSNEPTALDIDLIARLSGFRTGDDFVSHMKSFKEIKGKEAFGQFRAKSIRAEIERRMEAKYGKFEDLNAAEARQYVISPEAEDMLWHEYPVLADIAGQKIPFDREAVYQMALSDFGFERWNKRRASVKGIADELGRAARETHDAWQAGDKLGAFMARQKVVHLVAKARIAKEFEARTRSDKRLMKTLLPVEPTNMDPDYAMWAHQIMNDHEIPTKAGQDGIDARLQHPEMADKPKTFEDFVNSHNHPIDPENPGAVGLPLGYDDFRSTYNPNMPIWVDLLKPGGLQKPLEEMNVMEYKGVTNALRVLKKLGQDKSKGIVIIRGEEYKLDELRPKLIAMLDTFGFVKQPRPGRELPVRQSFRRNMARLQGTEAWIDRLARYSEDSVWHDMYYAVSEADHENTRLRTEELSPRMRKAFEGIDQKWLNKPVDPGPLTYPGTNQPMETTNETIVAWILNWASDDMRAHTAGGYGMEVAQGQAWLDTVATQKHYDLARKIAGLMDWTQSLEDNMTMKRSGAMLERDPLGRIVEPDKGDQIGWYYPRKRDTRYSSPPEKMDPKRKNVKISMAMSHHEERTGAVYPVQLHLTGLADDLERRVKFVTIQPVLDIWNKVLNHPSIEQSVKAHFGEERWINLKQWFNDIAGVQGTRSDMDLRVTGWFNQLNTRTVTDFIGFNIKTFFKHAPQSFYQSVKEIGWNESFKAAARSLSRSPANVENANHDFMWNGAKIAGRDWKGIGELKIRRRAYEDEPGHVMDEILGKTYKIGDVTRGMSRWGAAPIAVVDSKMSEVTGLAKYNLSYPKELAKLTEGKVLTPEQWMEAEWKAHQKSADLASKSIRMTHGSTSISGKPELLRSQNPMVQANVKAMTFFNNALQRRIRSVNMTIDALTGKSPRPWHEDARKIFRDFNTYVILPTLIEDAVEPICKADDDALVCTGKMVAQGFAAPIPIVRDVVHSILTGTPITGGIAYGLVHFGAKTVSEFDKAFIEGDQTRLGDFIENLMGFAGGVTGFPGAVLGREIGYLIKVAQGEEDWPGMDLPKIWHVLARGTTEPTKHEAERKRLIQRLVE
jgi:hypothetical protein